MERAHRPAFMPVLPLVYSHLLGAPSLGNAPELAALAVNLTQDRQLAEVHAAIGLLSQHMCDAKPRSLGASGACAMPGPRYFD